MIDPPNSYGSHVPPLAPSTITLSRADGKADSIERLRVSKSWKRRFRLIDRAGGRSLPHFRYLTFGERIGLNFNAVAFIFGPIYYLIKGLWRQAILYFVCAIALVFLLQAIGLGRFSQGIGYGLGAAYALRANVSYYRKIVLGEVRWL